MPTYENSRESLRVKHNPHIITPFIKFSAIWRGIISCKSHELFSKFIFCTALKNNIKPFAFSNILSILYVLKFLF